MVHSISSAGLNCRSLLTSSTLQGDTLNYDQKVREIILKNPESLVDKKIHGKDGNIGFPFSIRSLKTLPSHLLIAVTDLHVLSNSDRARSRIFGSSKRQDELTTDLLSAPLLLNSQANPTDGLFVEVGVDVFTLDNGQHRYIYWTSNADNFVTTPFEFRADLIE